MTIIVKYNSLLECSFELEELLSDLFLYCIYSHVHLPCTSKSFNFTKYGSLLNLCTQLFTNIV